jgi:hypothetical protein
MDEVKHILNRLEHKMDITDSKISNIDVTLAKQEEQLRFHIKRTDLLQSSIEQVEKEIKPIQVHVNRMDGAIKLLGFISLLIGVCGSILKLLRIL